MLIALFTYLMLSGSGAGPTIENLRYAEKAVEQVVADDVRREAAIGVLEEMALVVREYSRDRTELAKAFEKAGRDFEASSVDLLAVLEPGREKTLELQDRLIVLFSELKTHLTASEWDQMYALIREH